jgi:hypothetical protein
MSTDAAVMFCEARNARIAGGISSRGVKTENDERDMPSRA